MKKNKRWAFVFLLACILLLTSFMPAAANISTSSVTGYCAIDFSYTPPSASRWWNTGENGYHERNDFDRLVCNFTDDRLDGFQILKGNWDGKYYLEPFWYFTGISHGKLWVTAANDDLLWEGEFQIFYSPLWVYQGKSILHGRGVYEGLKATLDVWGDFTKDPGVFFAGTITDPGN